MMTPEERGAWLAQRAGKLTASRMGDAMDFLKSGKPSAKRSGYMRDLLAERLTDYSTRHYVTPAMEHGLQYEDDARMAYEAATGNLVMLTGFYDHPSIDAFGATPDGLLVPDGLIETKCPTPGTFVDWVLAGEVPEEHKPQMTAQCACTGRKWCEFVAYDPRIREPERRLFIRRFTPSAEELAAVETAAEQFLSELDALWAAFHTARAA